MHSAATAWQTAKPRGVPSTGTHLGQSLGQVQARLAAHGWQDGVWLLLQPRREDNSRVCVERATVTLRSTNHMLPVRPAAVW